MDLVTLSLVALVGLPFRSEAPPAEAPCAWSAVWPKLKTGRYRAGPLRRPGGGAYLSGRRWPMDLVTLSLVALVGLPFRSEAPPAGPPCAWSAVWPKLKTGRYRAVPTGVDVVEPPRKVKVTRPASDVKRTVKGNWKLDVVIDQTGAVRDVRIAERPKVEPEWPEFEAQVLATVKAARIGPATVEGQPWPHCMTVTVKD